MRELGTVMWGTVWWFMKNVFFIASEILVSHYKLQLTDTDA
jgi:hypothetical protein